jgi:hypothetical protein
MPFPLPHVDTYTFNKQLGEYKVAVARLAQYVLSVGREEVTEMQDTLEVVVDDEGMPVLNDDGEVTYVQEEVVVVSAVDPLDATVEITVFNFDDFEAEPSINTIENPEITQDNLERTEAQGVVDTTPLEVIDHYTEN